MCKCFERVPPTLSLFSSYSIILPPLSSIVIIILRTGERRTISFPICLAEARADCSDGDSGQEKNRRAILDLFRDPTLNSPIIRKFHSLFVIVNPLFPFLLLYIMHIYVTIEPDFLQ